MKDQNSKIDLLHPIFARKNTILAVTIIIFSISVFIAFFWPPTYSATASILIREKGVQKNPVALEAIQQQIDQFELSKEDLTSEIETLTSFEVIKRATRTLEKNGFFADAEDSGLPSLKELISKLAGSDEAPSALIHKRIYKIKSNLSTMVVPASNVIEILLTHRDPQKAVQILNTLLDEYLVYHGDIHNPAKQSFFSDHAQEFRREIEQKNNELFNLVKKSGVPDPKKEMDNLLSQRLILQQHLYTLKNDKEDKTVLIKTIRKSFKKSKIQFFSFLNNLETLKNLGLKLQDLFIEQGHLLRKYQENSPRVKLIDKQIKETFATLKNEVYIYMEALEEEIKSIDTKTIGIKKNLAEIDRKSIALQGQAIAQNKIQQELGMLQQSYDAFSRRKEESRINSSANDSFLPASIISRAFPSNGPLFPNKKVVLPFGLLAGLMTGLSLAFIAEYLNHTFKRPEDVEMVTGLPVIFSIKNWE